MKRRRRITNRPTLSNKLSGKTNGHDTAATLMKTIAFSVFLQRRLPYWRWCKIVFFREYLLLCGQTTSRWRTTERIRIPAGRLSSACAWRL